MSFCRRCGKECVKEFTGYYNQATGEKAMRDVCPDEPCKHGECDGVQQHRWFGSDYKCKRCGNEWSLY